MLFYVYLVMQAIVAIGASIGSRFLILSAFRAFKEKRIAKGAGLSLAALLMVSLAIFFILAVFGGIMTAIIVR